MEDAVILTSPTSLLGKSLAHKLANSGHNLIFLTWRSDLAEKLMFEVLEHSDVKIQIIRQDLGVYSWSNKVWKKMLSEEFCPKTLVRVPLIEENSIPRLLSVQDSIDMLLIIKNNFDKLGENIKLSSLNHHKIINVEPNIENFKLTDYLNSHKLNLVFGYPKQFTKYLQSLPGLLTIGEAEVVSERIMKLLKQEGGTNRLFITDYLTTILRILTSKINKTY